MTQPPQRWLASFLLATAASFAALSPADLPAETITWDGGGADNLWSTPENWSGDVVPGREDDVVFDGTSGKVCLVNLDETGPQTRLFVPGGGGDIHNLTVEADYAGAVAFIEKATITLVGDFTQRGGHVDWGYNFQYPHMFRGSFRMEGGTTNAAGSWFAFHNDSLSPVERILEGDPARVPSGETDDPSQPLRGHLAPRRRNVRLEYLLHEDSFAFPPFFYFGNDMELVVAGEIDIESGGSFAVAGKGSVVLEDGAALDMANRSRPVEFTNEGLLSQLGTGGILYRADYFTYVDESGAPEAEFSPFVPRIVRLRDPDENVDGRMRDAMLVEVVCNSGTMMEDREIVVFWKPRTRAASSSGRPPDM